MTIGEVFKKEITRPIKGVITVGGSESADEIKQELEEYVVTREIRKHMKTLYNNYCKSLDGKTTDIGVWVSGFFGSGKSHFERINAALLDNSVIDGKEAIEYFIDEDKLGDEILVADIRRAASVPTDVIQFNIDSRSEMTGKHNKEAIGYVLLKVFNEMQGFCGAIPLVADIERSLSKRGLYDEFKAKFEEIYGSPWVESRDEFDYVQDEVVEALVAIGAMSEEAARKSYAVQYSVIEYAYKIIYAGKYEPVSILKDIVKNYRERYYENDRNYRLFYFYYDKLTETSTFEKLRELIENIYTNDYLQNICTNWTKAFVEEAGSSGLPLQINFWRDRVEPIKERVVVFISDAMRYEVGVSLYEKLNADEKCKASLYAMQTVLPSITMCGMAALLPHKTYELTPDYRLLVDGKPCASTTDRAKIVAAYNPKSLCIQYDELKVKKVDELKALVSGLEVIYVYHNQIDARGDKAPTEDEVFIACQEAVDEIAFMIRRLTGTNVTRFLVTSDHGFVYKRDELQAQREL